MAEHVYHFGTIGVGHSFQAVSYCYRAKIPLLLNSNKPYNLFAIAKQNGAFQNLPVAPGSQTLNRLHKGRESIINIKPALYPVWNKCLEIMSIAGKLPFLGKISGIVVEEEKKLLKITTLEGRLIRATYDLLFVFEDRNVKFREITPTGIDKDEKTYRIKDWGKTLNGNTHKIDLMYKLGDEDYGDIVVRFYKRTSRSDVRDFVSIFSLKERELYDKDFSMVLTRFKLIDFFEDNKFPTSKFAKGRVDIEMLHREHTPNWKNVYEDAPGIKFVNEDEAWLTVHDALFTKLETLLA